MASTTRCALGALEGVGATSTPPIASTVTDDPGPLFQGLDNDAFGSRNPQHGGPSRGHRFSEEQLDRALEAVGDFCDMRCPYFAGHGGGTAELVAEAASFAATFLRRGDTRSAGRARP